MTVGYLIELLCGKIGALSGKIMDGAGFSNMKIEDLEGQLKNLGFRYDGKETLYNGITGEKYKAKIFVGVQYYQKLKYMVSNIELTAALNCTPKIRLFEQIYLFF